MLAIESWLVAWVGQSTTQYALFLDVAGYVDRYLDLARYIYPRRFNSTNTLLHSIVRKHYSKRWTTYLSKTPTYIGKTRSRQLHVINIIRERLT
jgi:hypothetical protein